MKLFELNVTDEIVSELIPSNATGDTTMAPGQQVTTDPDAQRKMQAQQALDRQEKRKAIQDEIKLKQSEIQRNQEALRDLRQQLAQLR